jgi:hypothetical protein
MPSFEEMSDEQRANLGRAAFKLFHNPEVSARAKRLLTEADPTIRFPEIDQEKIIGDQLSERDKRIAELEQRQIQQAAEARREKSHAEARARGLDPAAVEDAIVKRKIGDWDTAMEFVEMSTRMAAATPASFDRPSSMDMPDNKDLWKDPTKWARGQAHDEIDRILKQRRAG